MLNVDKSISDNYYTIRKYGRIILSLSSAHHAHVTGASLKQADMADSPSISAVDVMKSHASGTKLLKRIDHMDTSYLSSLALASTGNERWVMSEVYCARARIIA
ncbi:hypothetical protein TNCV_2133671 [Trichonephila clavipes]|nr:hypothetical protein TNCV_2133671 [Trichonephila clavipes]